MTVDRITVDGKLFPSRETINGHSKGNSMTQRNLGQDKLTILRPAPRGSKRGWVPVTTEVEPEKAERLQQIANSQGVYRTELLYRAVDLLLEMYERAA